MTKADTLPSQQFGILQERWKAAHVWVVGDVMLDRWIRGDAERISPEAPVPVVRVTERTASLGGAANVARSVVALGASVTLAGVVGDDDAGHRVIALASALGVDTGALLPSVRPTTSKVRVMAHGQQLVRYDTEDATPLESAVAKQLIAQLERAGKPDAIIASDYAKGVLTAEVFAWLSAFAKTHDVPLLVDPKTADFSRYQGATVITPNAGEFAAAAMRYDDTPVDLDDTFAMGRAARQMADDADAGALLITLGARGMAVWQRDLPMARVGATARRVYDVTGAGDTVMATLTLGLVAGLSLVDAAALANRAAGLAVERPGAAEITARELAATLAEPERTRGALDDDSLAARLAWWRLRGETVVFTNGCFDLIHTGHLSLLEQAAAFGDILVVGLNSDASVSRLKGPTRPLNNERDRAEILTALSCVDAVVIFGEDTPMELLKRVKPDVLVKGADYTLDRVVGRTEVESWGGRVALAQLVDGRSTTNVVERIRDQEKGASE